ncbi:hypothetical protein HAZT_HAZT005374 [Hyalella azteca]|uniref:Ig-like domain-containing protein n=1 Tax=Hyalella azteca TaxID=294128 RepID=A0A6A0GQD4_HYAAZ|nr:hypothetical protein HAZT_HAZT005374 [Hyalella azteca]
MSLCSFCHHIAWLLHRAAQRSTVQFAGLFGRGFTRGRPVHLKHQYHLSVPPAIRPFEFGSVIAGMRARVSCLVALGDPPLTIRWLKDGLPLDTPMVHDIIMTHPDDYTSSIVLAAVEPRHAGNYTCLARNPARETSYTAVLDVQGISLEPNL